MSTFSLCPGVSPNETSVHAFENTICYNEQSFNLDIEGGQITNQGKDLSN